MTHGLEAGGFMTEAFKDKSHALLVLLCSELVSCEDALAQADEPSNNARRLFCQALLAIAKATLESYPIGRMASSKLVKELTLLSSQYESIGEGTDTWVRRTMQFLRKNDCINTNN
jgi:serine/threonine-protein kinase ATR